MSNPYYFYKWGDWNVWNCTINPQLWITIAFWGTRGILPRTSSWSSPIHMPVNRFHWSPPGTVWALLNTLKLIDWSSPMLIYFGCRLLTIANLNWKRVILDSLPDCGELISIGHFQQERYSKHVQRILQNIGNWLINQSNGWRRTRSWGWIGHNLVQQRHGGRFRTCAIVIVDFVIGCDSECAIKFVALRMGGRDVENIKFINILLPWYVLTTLYSKIYDFKLNFTCDQTFYFFLNFIFAKAG